MRCAETERGCKCVIDAEEWEGEEGRRGGEEGNMRRISV